MKSDSKNIIIPSVGKYNGHIDFYRKALEKSGYNIKSQYNHELHVKDTLLICETPNFYAVDSIFILKIIEERKNCSLMVIIEKKDKYKTPFEKALN